MTPTPGGIQAGSVPPPPGGIQAGSIPPPPLPEGKHRSKGPAATEADVTRIDAGAMPKERKAALKEVFLLIDRTLQGTRQYGREHVETRRRFAVAFAQVEAALATSDDALVWNVTPYSFQAGDLALWEPEAPLDLVPYRLFSSGVRTMGVLPGLMRAELSELLRLWMLDPATEVSPEDDLVTLLWDAGFEHVAFEAIDAFVDGDQKARGSFEREAQGILQQCRAEYDADLTRATAAHRATKPAPEEAPADRLKDLLLAGDRPVDVEGVARAQGARLAGTAAPSLSDAVRIDPAARSVLAAQLDAQPDDVSERFVRVAARAFEDAEKHGRARALVASLRGAVDGLADARPGAAVELVCGLCGAVLVKDAGETERLRTVLAEGIVSAETMARILDGAVADTADRGAFQTGLDQLLRYLDGSHVPRVLPVLMDERAEPILPALLGYLARRGRGHEAAMGALFAKASVEVGLGLVRVLAELGTPEARQGVLSATKSPHALVRIEALGHLEGQSSERLRLELAALIEDKDGVVRLATLRRMAKYQVRAAGPYLVLRLKRSDFHDLPYDERREALATVLALTAARAEAVCIELLSARQFFASSAHEETRELSAQMLGEIGRSTEAKAALSDAAERILKSSERVRTAARRALERWGQRGRSMPPPGRGASPKSPDAPSGKGAP